MPETLVNGVDLSKLPQPLVAGHPEWRELYDFAWRLAAQHIRVSRGRRHMDAAWDPKRNFQWVWDTCFMALYCRYGAGQYPGVESLDNFYEMQRADGYIGMTYDMTTGEEPWPNRINPPLFAWVEWEYWRTTGDASRLPRVLPHLAGLLNWIEANRRTAPHRRHVARDCPEAGRGESVAQYQLYYFEDCGSSGMDDAPRTPRVYEAGPHFDWIDLSSQMALACGKLAALYQVAGDGAAAAEWGQRSRAIGELVNTELWCERSRFYHDRFLPRNFVGHKTAAGFWPLVAGICPPERVKALVAHLRDPREFGRPTPVPSLSADDLNYCPEGTYWCGGVWAPTNYMVTRGLQLAGRSDVAHEVAVKYLGALARTYAAVEPHTLWECYSPEHDQPGLAAYTHHRVKPDFVGWTGIGPIAMLIENVIGLDADVPARHVTWDLRLTEEHGVRQFPLGAGATADFHCAARTTAAAAAAVEMRSDVELTVTLRRGRKGREVVVRAGDSAQVQV